MRSVMFDIYHTRALIAARK